MKNQYFGDVNDYKKYGLLRILSGNSSIRTAICWMLTEDNDLNDGKFTDYLQKPQKWKAFDPILYESLNECLSNIESRNVSWAEIQNLVPSAKFFSKILTDNALERQPYFQQFLSIAKGCELIFFDPDNGLEVKSVSYGNKDSCKYLYWHELLSAFKAGHSILLYQHFKRIKRDEFIRTIAKELCERTNVYEVIAFRTSNVVFMLIPQSCHLSYFRGRTEEVKKVWTLQIKVTYYP